MSSSSFNITVTILGVAIVASRLDGHGDEVADFTTKKLE